MATKKQLAARAAFAKRMKAKAKKNKKSGKKSKKLPAFLRKKKKS